MNRGDIPLRWAKNVSAPSHPSSMLRRTGSPIFFRSFNSQIRASPLQASSRPRPPSLRPLYAAPLFSTKTARMLSLWPFSQKEQQSSPSIGVSEKGKEDTTASSPDAIVGTSEAQSPSTINDISHGTTSKASEATTGHVESTVERVEEAASVAADTGEAGLATLDSLGQLSSWKNVQWASELLNWVVDTTGLPWWATIATLTIGIRLLVFPLVIKGQRNAMRMAKIHPEISRHMQNAQAAKKAGDQRLLSESVMASQKLFKDNDCSIGRSFYAPLVQMPIFITFFFALRKMADAGLGSMRDGGMAWFTDLTMADPYVLLPALSSGLTLAVLETGAEMGVSAQSQQTQIARNIMRFASVGMLPFIYTFPAAVFVYWSTNNAFSLLQLRLLQIPAVRRRFHLPPKPKPEHEDLPPHLRPQKEGMVDRFKKLLGERKNQELANTSRSGSQPRPLTMVQRQADESREKALNRMMSGEQTLQGSDNKVARKGEKGEMTNEKDLEEGRRYEDEEKRRRIAAARDRRKRKK